MASLKDAAQRALKTQKEKEQRDLDLALACYDGQVYRIGPLTLRPPTMLAMLVLEELGYPVWEAITGDKVSLQAVLRILVVIEMTSEPGKLPGTSEERRKAIEARVREIAAQIPLPVAPEFLVMAIQAIAHMLTPPERAKGGQSYEPFPASNQHRPHSSGVENETA